jgi:hypothetical protein
MKSGVVNTLFDAFRDDLTTNDIAQFRGEIDRWIVSDETSDPVGIISFLGYSYYAFHWFKIPNFGNVDVDRTLSFNSSHKTKASLSCCCCDWHNYEIKLLL